MACAESSIPAAGVRGSGCCPSDAPEIPKAFSYRSFKRRIVSNVRVRIVFDMTNDALENFSDFNIALVVDGLNFD